MHINTRTTLIAIAASILTTVVMQGVIDKANKKKQIYVSPLVRSAVNPSARSALAIWGEMQQAEVDKLTERLKAIPEKDREPVVVFCGDNSTCGDMALDLENAFESAHWKIDTQRPMFDDSKGLTTNSATIAEAMDLATDGRLKPEVVERKRRLGCGGAMPIQGVDCSNPLAAIYISLGRKPK